MTNDGLGDRCKRFEAMEASRCAYPGIPLLARLDGRAFHTFTRGLARPYDAGMSRCMVETTRFLVDEFHARVGYTQSDEITLAWFVSSTGPSEYPFSGRFQKVSSVLAGAASARFAQLVRDNLPEKACAVPHFDCRAWQAPTREDAADVFVWREDDAVKNSVSMAAGAYYSPAQLHGKNSAEKHDLLHAVGINWNDYPVHFKRGTYLQRQTHSRRLTDEERERIPEAHRPTPDALFQRSTVVVLDLPPIRAVANRTEVLLGHEAPVTVGTPS